MEAETSPRTRAPGWSGVPDAVRAWVEEELERDPPVLLLQVGSTARGYALPGADYDFMAFFADDRATAAVHAELGGIRASVDANSLTRFLHGTADFRFNLAALRQLHKVRDGILLRESGADADTLLNVAAAAHLDRGVVLAQCARIADQAPTVAAWPVVAQHQQLIGWTEWLATLDAVSRPGAEAYTKPKWLHRTLQRTGAVAALDALQLLYDPGTADPVELLDGLDRQWASDCRQGLPYTQRGMLITAMSDARDAVEHFPTHCFTQLRFAAGQLHRCSCVEEPVPVLARGGQLPNHTAAAMRCCPEVSVDPAWRAFRRMYAPVARAAVHDARRAWTSPLGSRRFYTEILAYYDATDLMPHAAAGRVTAMAASVERFLAGRD